VYFNSYKKVSVDVLNGEAPRYVDDDRVVRKPSRSRLHYYYSCIGMFSVDVLNCEYPSLVGYVHAVSERVQGLVSPSI